MTKTTEELEEIAIRMQRRLDENEERGRKEFEKSELKIYDDTYEELKGKSSTYEELWKKIEGTTDSIQTRWARSRMIKKLREDLEKIKIPSKKEEV